MLPTNEKLILLVINRKYWQFIAKKTLLNQPAEGIQLRKYK